ncbi:hypothetical protein JCM11491_003482 [Sporobolomyces phaffii]
MSSLLPPPPPRHPSSRSSSPLRSDARLSRTPSHSSAREPTPTPDTTAERSPPLPFEPPTVIRSTASSQSQDDGTPTVALPPPPKHPHLGPTDEMGRKLAEIEDLEIAEMLDRVGGRLKELRVAADDEETVSLPYPIRDDFRDESGAVDWPSFITAFASTFVVSHTPPSLVGHPPQREFSLRFLRDDLSRTYVLCPPSVWRGYLLTDLAKLYRWQDPIRTGKAAALYTFLWFFDLLPLFPIGLLIYYMLAPRLSPPTPEEILATANERASRTREAEELSKQLKTSSAGRGLGFAAEGIRGVVGDLKDRLPIGRSRTEEKTLAHALGSTALLGGMAGGGTDYGETLRHRLGRKGEEESRTSEAASRAEAEREQDGFDDSLATDKTGDISLYRLIRSLLHSFGPPLQTMMNETIDLLEMVRNVIQHPDHPASLPVLYRLCAVFALVLVTPTWLRLKSAFGYLGLEFFALWYLREAFPQYRRATMIQWWIFSGAPTDADYALYVLRKRGAEGKAIRGSKTIRRMARRSRATSNADLGPEKNKAVHRLAKTVSDTASIRSFASSTTSSPSDKPTSTYFAFHRSVPGQIVLSSTSIRFVPAKRLRKLGFQKLVARAARKWDSSIELDESYYHDDDDDGTSLNSLDTSATSLESDRRDLSPEMKLRVDEIEKVKKDRQYRLPALEISSKNGETWKFTNVSRRDDAFNKLLSFSASSWTRT